MQRAHPHPQPTRSSARGALRHRGSAARRALLGGRLTLGVLCLVAVAALAAAGAVAAEAPDRVVVAGTHPVPSAVTWLDRGFLRGMTVTCPTWGPIWGTQHMDDALAHLDELGVEWVAIHPYARIRRDGSVGFEPAQTLEFLDRAAELVRRRQMHLFLKPHLAYWGSFQWRGEIEFETDAQWQRFFEDYRAFIVDQARFAERQGIDLLAIGTELEGTTHHEAPWREIIAAVRAVYSGTLVYAANWDRVDDVPFWDALDAIGVQAYYPLSDLETPQRADLESGWKRPLEHLGSLSRRLGGKPVLFTELGYNRAPEAAREPWSYRTLSTEESRRLRRLLMDVALERLEGHPAVRGVFWWKWMPGPSAGRSNFSMRDTEAQEALREAWVTDRPARR